MSKVGSLGILVLFACSVYPVASQDFDPTKVKGDLQKIKEPLAALFKLTSKGGKLAAEVEKDRQTAYQQVNKINAVGSNRGGGSSSSGSTWEIRINNTAFEGSCNFGYSRVYPKPNPNTWRIKLKELKKPNRDLSIEAGPNGEISISLYGGDDPYLLRIRQLKSGNIFVQEVSDTDIFSESSPSFDVFCRRHSQFTQDRLLPIIRHLGIDAPMTQFDRNVQKSVISFLTPIEDEQLASFQTSFKNLDSQDYDKRLADSKKLSDGFANWQNFVMRAINDPNFSFEVRFRLMEALEKNGKPDEIKASRFAISTGLADNPEYLIWLFEIHENPSVRNNILAQLKRTAGEDLGPEISVWKNRFASRSAEIKTDRQPPVNLLAEKGSLDKIRPFVGQLVRLKTGDRKLQLDRKFWSDQFGGKSVQQLVKETNANLAKLNMPANYDPDPLFELGSVGHPQAIFSRMRSQLANKQKSSSVYYYNYNRTSSSSLNRQYNDNQLNLTMNFEPNSTTTVRRVSGKNMDAKPPKLDDKPLKLDFRELDDARRSLMIHHKTDGHLRLAIVTDKSNAFVQILQKPDGNFIVQDVRGPEIFTSKASTFSEFVEKNRTYCNEKLFPLFSHYGVAFSPELFDAPAKPADNTDENQKPKSEEKPIRGKAIDAAETEAIQEIRIIR